MKEHREKKMSRKIVHCFLLFFRDPFPSRRQRKKKTFITKDSSKLEVNEWDELLFYTCSKIYTLEKEKECIFSLKLKAKGDFNLSVVKR